jgi:hypothetical protein
LGPTENTVTITPWPAHIFQATLDKAPGGLPFNNLTVSCAGQIACDSSQLGVSDGTQINLTGFAPELNGPKINQFLLQVTNTNAGAPAMLGVSGVVRDSLDTSPIPGMPLTDYQGHFGAANGSGIFNYPVGGTGQTHQILVTFSCPPGGPGVTTVCTPSANPIYVYPSANTINIGLNSYFNGSAFLQYYSYRKSLFYLTGAAPVISNRTGLLTYYGLKGRVVDALTNAPISGILVCDKNWQLDLTNTGTPLPTQPNPPYNGQCVTTDINGQYVFTFQAGAQPPPPALVSNRYVDTFGNKNYGFLEAYVPSGRTSAATGKSYAGGGTGPVLIPGPLPPGNSPGYADLAPANDIRLSPAPGSI